MGADGGSALHLLLTGDPTLFAIVRLSIAVSLSATILAASVGAPFGALVALTRFPGREVVIVALNALMGLPPVMVGLMCYLALSRSGPLGAWGLLFTPKAMVIAQTILVTPIIAAITRQTVEDLWVEYRDELAAMDVGPVRRVATLLWDGRFSLTTAFLAGYGRAAAEGLHHHRRRQHRGLYAHYHDGDGARDLEGQPSARDRVGHRPTPHRGFGKRAGLGRASGW